MLQNSETDSEIYRRFSLITAYQGTSPAGGAAAAVSVLGIDSDIMHRIWVREAGVHVIRILITPA